MARKVKKKTAAQNPQARTEKNPEKASFFKKNKKLVIIVSAVLAAAIVTGIVFGIIALVNGGKEVDFLNDDLSKYVYIASEDYKNYPVSIPLLSVDESDVLREINRLRVKNKDKNALFGGASVRPNNYTVKLGDVANIWYRAYSVDENGTKTDISGASNLKDSAPYPLEIGSTEFVKGFEEALIGKPLHTKSPEFLKSGKVQPGDIIYISYSAFLPNGTPTTVSDVVIDTADKASVDKLYGNGFAEFFIGKTIGDVKGMTEAFKIEGESVDAIYYEMKINYAVRCDEEPYLVNVVFPANYKEKSLRGVAACFEVYAVNAVLYNNVPEFNDAFITEKLKETPESLSAYEGETLSKKYESKIKSELEAAKETTNDALIEEEMWSYYHEKLEVKKLPKKEVEEFYLEYLAEISEYYSIYGVSFESFDEFARYYLKLSEKADWRAHLRSSAEAAVTERLLFYYIINKEGIKPDAAEYERLFKEAEDEHMKNFLDLYKTDLEACKTEEEKAAKLLEIEKKFDEYYGEEYFSELVYYQYGIERLIDFANVK